MGFGDWFFYSLCALIVAVLAVYTIVGVLRLSRRGRNDG